MINFKELLDCKHRDTTFPYALTCEILKPPGTQKEVVFVFSFLQGLTLTFDGLSKKLCFDPFFSTTWKVTRAYFFYSFAYYWKSFFLRKISAENWRFNACDVNLKKTAFKTTQNSLTKQRNTVAIWMGENLAYGIFAVR